MEKKNHFVTVYLKNGAEKQIPVSEIETYLTKKIDETELRYEPPKCYAP
ncbi:MAG TPA: hypothetical protein V6D19_05390 [Stenomitos sp.]